MKKNISKKKHIFPSLQSKKYSSLECYNPRVLPCSNCFAPNQITLVKENSFFILNLALDVVLCLTIHECGPPVTLIGSNAESTHLKLVMIYSLTPVLRHLARIPLQPVNMLTASTEVIRLIALPILQVNLS